MICNVLKEKILAAYPAEDVYSVLSSFLFLRFFCPAIFDPQNNMKMGKGKYYKYNVIYLFF